MLDERAATGPFVLDSSLTLDDVAAIAIGHRPIALSEAARGRIAAARSVTEELLAGDEHVYGLTTGVGALKRVRVGLEEQLDFNRLLLRAHRTGTGADAPAAAVRAAMVAQLGGFARGYSGAGLALAEHLVAALNAGFTPRVRTIGSLGQSDLGPLADLACGLIGEGAYAGELAALGLEPWRPLAKEALAFVNSNAFTLGWTALALQRVGGVLDRFDESAALTFEGMLGNVQALDPAVAAARPLPGSRETIDRIQALLAGGALMTGELHRQLQDPLTMRIVPQTHGAARTALAHAREIVEIELVSSHDNPAMTPDGRALSNGNFDSVPYGIALDYVRLALAHVLTASNERAQKLVYSAFSGLPTGLREDDAASEDGLAITVYGSSAAAAEARLLAHPTTLELSTSSTAEGIEDRVIPTTLAARRLDEMIGLARYVAAVELVCAAQAVDLRTRAADLGRGTRSVYQLVREHVPFCAAGDAPTGDLGDLERALADRG